MRIVRRSEVTTGAWDELAESSPAAWLFHRAAWVDIEARFFVASDLSFALVEGDRLIAVQPLYLNTAAQGTPHGERLIHSGVHRHAGLALAPGLDRRTRVEAEALVMRHILELGVGHGADRVQLSVQNLAPQSLTDRRDMIPYWASDYGFGLGLGFGPNGIEPAPGFTVLAADQIIELHAPESELWSGLDGGSCRNSVRKAEKAGLAFATTTDPGALDRYWSMAQRSAERTGESLPLRDYYETILAALAPFGRVRLCFARDGERDVAALVLLEDKAAVSFLAGISEPDALSLRPNDFIHWRAIQDAKARGAAAYRFGPVFPEVPADWPIARVSAFKAKFGARSVPTIVGSLFLDPAAAEAAVQRAAAIMPALARRLRIAKPARSHAADIVAHSLRVIGVTASVESDAAGVLVADAGVEGGWQTARMAAAAGRPAVVLRPERAHRYLDGLSFAALASDVPRLARALAAGGRPWQRLRTFHVTHAIESDRGVPVVVDGAGHTLWCWLPLGRAGVLLIGTELARDLTLIRQGDPAAAANRPTEAQWGFAGERPTYLFEGQLEPDRPHERYADWWLWTLRDALERHGDVVPRPVLPFGAPGAVVVTGDDDQAALADYKGQAEKLGPLPVTYFLHPLTKHDRVSLAAHAEGRAIEWELHPDALETPHAYTARLSEQTRWFEALTGRRARLVRNHGFLNDGYWGHAAAWMAEGIIGSSNLPGLDARMLNGSLLPARLALDGQLTAHWSVLTAFGDGVFFIHEWDGARAQAAVMAEGRRILESGVPGILVFNLHPANHEKAAGMHQAVRALLDELGFTAMTLGDAIKWFQARDEGSHLEELDSMIPPRSFSSRRSRSAFARTALAFGRHVFGGRRRERFGDA